MAITEDVFAVVEEPEETLITITFNDTDDRVEISGLDTDVDAADLSFAVVDPAGDPAPTTMYITVAADDVIVAGDGTATLSYADLKAAIDGITDVEWDGLAPEAHTDLSVSYMNDIGYGDTILADGYGQMAITEDVFAVVEATPQITTVGTAGRVSLTYANELYEYENGILLGELQWIGQGLTPEQVSFSVHDLSIGEITIADNKVYLEHDYHLVESESGISVVGYEIGYSDGNITSIDTQGNSLISIKITGNGLSDNLNNNWEQFAIDPEIVNEVAEEISLNPESFGAYEIGAVVGSISSTIDTHSYDIWGDPYFEISGTQLKLKPGYFYDPHLERIINVADESYYEISGMSDAYVVSYQSSMSDANYIEQGSMDHIFDGVTTVSGSSMPYYAGTPTTLVNIASDPDLQALLLESGTPNKTEIWSSNPNYTYDGKTVITYSFIQDDSTKFGDNYADPVPGSEGITISQPSELQQNAIVAALTEYENVADLHFVEVQEENDIVGTMRFGVTNYDKPDAAAWAVMPTTSSAGGDIWLKSAPPLDEFNSDYERGSGYGFQTLLHEIGHALGLKHPFEGSPQLTSLDNKKYTIMSYTDDDTLHPVVTIGASGVEGLSLTPGATYALVSDMGGFQAISGIWNDEYNYFTPNNPPEQIILDQEDFDTVIEHAETTRKGDYDALPESNAQTEDAYVISWTPMKLDIAAIQSLYGENMDYEVADSHYTFDPNIPFAKTIWDAGSEAEGDTLDFGGFSEDLLIDLRDGHSSTIPTSTWKMDENLWIADGATIENVISGSGNDTIKGNEVDNLLIAGSGDDKIYGYEGTDTFVVKIGDGVDEIMDYNRAEDILVLLDESGSAISASDASLSIVEGDQSSIIKYSGEVVLELQGLEVDTLASLTIDDTFVV